MAFMADLDLIDICIMKQRENERTREIVLEK
jgi:hypothetical protein